METSTSESIKSKISRDCAYEFAGVATSMQFEGVDKGRIIDAFVMYVESRARRYREKCNLKPIGSCINLLLDEIKGRKADSPKEADFYCELCDRKIPFVFQQKIGPYRADYLFGENTILECDGKHHDMQVEYDTRRDNYLKRMGYNVIRLPWSLIDAAPEVVFGELKKIAGCDDV